MKEVWEEDQELVEKKGAVEVWEEAEEVGDEKGVDGDGRRGSHLIYWSRMESKSLSG